MENLVKYLDESLVPLELKVKEYLDTERDIRLLEVELLSLQSITPNYDPDKSDMEQALKTGSQNNTLTEKEQKLSDLLEKYKNLRQEVVNMLPGPNQVVELNLGYGPSEVGYFTIDHETGIKLDEPILRVIH
ncbi:hypothetical protein [Pontibacter vulgaris]|uniref:hypothetical protein n=1 Tax=Pontibacter vulgaris TaxID=2905679 RepID=UPI001FA6DDCD|nr:hypothetical protein [Pontibacter vulgaris]